MQQITPKTLMQNNHRMVSMSVADWINIPDFPYQRNTEGRLERAVKGHLAVFSPTHQIVSMAVFPDGKRMKLDAHTRALAWARGLIPAPLSVTAIEYSVVNLDQALELYTQIDSQDAVEKPHERAYGAGRGAGIHNIDANWYGRSGLFGSPARLASAFRRGLSNATEKVDHYDAAAEHPQAVSALIEFNPPVRIMPLGLQTAFLLSYLKHGVKAIDFWTAYKEDKTTKIDDEFCPVYALRSFVVERNKRTRKYTMAEITGIALACFENYLIGKNYKSTPRPLDVTKYFPF